MPEDVLANKNPENEVTTFEEAKKALEEKDAQKQVEERKEYQQEATDLDSLYNGTNEPNKKEFEKKADDKIESTKENDSETSKES